MRQYFPIIDLIQNYSKKHISGDLSAGFTTGMLLIPQGMAYAVLAGLPVEYGLYASLITPLIYMIFGTSTRLVVGPAALDSILLASGMAAIAVTSTEDYVQKVMLIVFFAGIFQIIAGFLRFGFISQFFSQPLLKSFITAAAILIGFSQLKYLFQIKIVRSNYFHEVLWDIGRQYDSIQWKPLLLGVLAIAFIKGLGKLGYKKISTPLALVLGIIISYFFNFEAQGIAIVGEIPKGLPHFEMLQWNALPMEEIIPFALLLGVMGFTLASSISKSVEDEPHLVRPNQEFIALGLANSIGAFFGAYQADSSFSRTAINKASGANTRMSNVISSSIILIVLLFLTPLFAYLPKAVLGAVIIAAVPSLMDFPYFKSIRKISTMEWGIMWITFILTLETGMLVGLSVGVILSIAAFLYKSIKPHIARLGKLEGVNHYRNIERFDAQEEEGMLILRIDSPLYFTNISSVLGQLDQMRSEHEFKAIILDASSIYYMDVTAANELKSWINRCNQDQTEVYFTQMNGPIRDQFYQCDIVQMLGAKSLFINVAAAVDHVLHQQEPKSKEQNIANQNNNK